jgi:hypothetical protein
MALSIPVAVALAAAAPSGRAAVAPSVRGAASCGDALVLVIDGEIRCTHGGDVLPATRVRSRAVANVAPAPCPGNGRGGKRITVLYGYPSDTTPALKAQKPSIRAAIALADRNLDDATPEVGGQHYRFWCQDDRRVTITAVALAPIGDDGAFTFSDVIGSLSDLGDDDPRRVYAVFVDNIACCYGAGGQGTLYLDDRPGTDVNWNNVGGPHYSMVRLGLDPTFTALAFQHEVGHNLGAVQDSAPHSSLAGHCYDDLDVMCYADGGAYFDTGTMQTLCTATGVDGIEPWDCGQDDYYATEPAPGSYLDTHWNVARSGWLSWNA